MTIILFLKTALALRTRDMKYLSCCLIFIIYAKNTELKLRNNTLHVHYETPREQSSDLKLKCELNLYIPVDLVSLLIVP